MNHTLSHVGQGFSPLGKRNRTVYDSFHKGTQLGRMLGAKSQAHFAGLQVSRQRPVGHSTMRVQQIVVALPHFPHHSLGPLIGHHHTANRFTQFFHVAAAETKYSLKIARITLVQSRGY